MRINLYIDTKRPNWVDFEFKEIDFESKDLNHSEIGYFSMPYTCFANLNFKDVVKEITDVYVKFKEKYED